MFKIQVIYGLHIKELLFGILNIKMFAIECDL